MDFFEQLEKGRFGSFELKHQVGPNLLKGLLVSLLIHGRRNRLAVDLPAAAKRGSSGASPQWVTAGTR